MLALGTRAGQSGRMLLGRVCGALIVASLVVGCSAGSCHLVGCSSGVFVQYANAVPIAELPLDVTTCAAAVCNTQTDTIGLVLPGESTIWVSGNVTLDDGREGTIAVTFEVKSQATGQTIASASGTGHLHKNEPNGAGCAPTCYHASLTYDDTATLAG